MKHLLLFVVIVCVGVGGEKPFSGEARAEERIFPAMHARVRLLIPTDSGSSMPAGQLTDVAEAIIRKADALLSPKGESSDVYRINNAPPGDWITVNTLTIRVVEEARRWHKATNGVFDPTIGPVKKLFRFEGKALAEWPDEAAITEARKRTGMNALRVDVSECRISHPHSCEDADALATILSVLGPNEGREFFQQNDAKLFPDGVDAVLFVVTEDGSMRTIHLGVGKDGKLITEEP